MKSTKPTTHRRTLAEISLLSVDEVRAELVAASIRPIEFVPMNDEIFFQYPQPRLEAWQRYDWMAYAPIATDPFVLDFYTRNPQDDLRESWRKQLYEHELQTFVESLSRPQLMTQLKTVTVDDHFDRTPEPHWTIENYREELRGRLQELESAAPTTKRKKRTT